MSTGAREKSTAKQIAREKERQLLLEPWGIRPVERKVVYWKDFQEEYLAHAEGSKRSGTAVAYRYSLNHFAELAQSKCLHEISAATLQDFVARRSKRVKQPTVNEDLRAVRASLKWAAERGYIAKCPSFKNLFVRQDVKTPVAIPRDCREAMFAALDKPDLDLRVRSADWWRVFLTMIAELGVRRGEALGLT